MKSALLLVDLQNDFCQGGSLAVPQSKEVITNIQKLRKQMDFFDLTILTRDYHPPNHISFASNHRNTLPFTTLSLEHQQIELWPNHCVPGTYGCQFNSNITLKESDYIINKGTNQNQQVYSGFGTIQNPTILNNILNENNIEQVFVAGLAYDYCVKQTALSAKLAGYKVVIISDCTKGISSSSIQKARRTLVKANVDHIEMIDLAYKFVSF